MNCARKNQEKVNELRRTQMGKMNHGRKKKKKKSGVRITGENNLLMHKNHM